MPKPKLIYIVSSRYSGTTLLSAILGAHPDISTIGERKKFYIKSLRPGGKGRFDCSCGKLYSECEYWTAIRDEVIAKIPDSYLRTDVTQFRLYQNNLLNKTGRRITKNLIANNRSIGFTPFAGRIREMCEVNKHIVNSTLQLDDNEVFVDSSKPIHHALYLSLIEDFDFYVVYMIRDPRAQAASGMKYHKWSPEKAAHTWLREHSGIRKVFNTWNVKKYEMTYGRFCREPMLHLKEILDFAGVDKSQASLDFRSTSKHFSGNKRMLKAKTTEITERKDWLEQLSAQEIKTIEGIAGDFWEKERQRIERNEKSEHFIVRNQKASLSDDLS